MDELHENETETWGEIGLAHRKPQRPGPSAGGRDDRDRDPRPGELTELTEVV